MPREPSKTVLIVEDDDATQRLLAALMKRNGLGCHLASNGREAIEALQSRDFDAIILDLMMPAIDGRGVVDFLVREGRKTPVVVCTAAGTRVMEGLDSTLVRAVVRKPFDIEQLSATIAALVD